MKYKPTDMSDAACAYRGKQFNCDGKCYRDGICSAIDTCPATAFTEFKATILAVLSIAFTCLVIIGVIGYGFYKIVVSLLGHIS